VRLLHLVMCHRCRPVRCLWNGCLAAMRPPPLRVIADCSCRIWILAVPSQVNSAPAAHKHYKALFRAIWWILDLRIPGWDTTILWIMRPAPRSVHSRDDCCIPRGYFQNNSKLFRNFQILRRKVK
jgi:hypothetical protein